MDAALAGKIKEWAKTKHLAKRTPWNDTDQFKKRVAKTRVRNKIQKLSRKKNRGTK